MRRKALSRVLAEVVAIIVVLAGAAGAYLVYSTYYSAIAYDVSFTASGQAVGNKIVLNVKNIGSYAITSVNITFSSPYLGKFAAQNVNIAPGKSEVLVFQCQNVPETAVAKLVVEAEGNGGRKSSMISVPTVSYTSYTLQGGRILQPLSLTPDPRPLFSSARFIPERSAFVAVGRAWIFWWSPQFYYTSEVGLVTSMPLSDPSVTTTFQVTPEHYYLDAVYYDGLHFHFLENDLFNFNIYYVRATPNASGTLSLEPPVTINLSAINPNITITYFPCGTITVDSQGKVWIAVSVDFGTSTTHDYRILLLWHNVNDGNFTVDGYYQLCRYTGDVASVFTPLGRFIELSDSELHYIYTPYFTMSPFLSDCNLYDAVKNGDTWTQEKIVSNIAQWDAFSVFTDGENIHVVARVLGNQMVYRKYNVSRLWEDAQTLYSSFSAFPLTITSLDNILYCIFTENETTIKYMYYNGSWNTTPETLVSRSANVYAIRAPENNTEVLPLFWFEPNPENPLDSTLYFQMFQIQK